MSPMLAVLAVMAAVVVAFGAGMAAGAWMQRRRKPRTYAELKAAADRLQAQICVVYPEAAAKFGMLVQR